MNGAFRLGVIASANAGRGDPQIHWSTATQWDHVAANNSPGWEGYTLRQRVSASLLPAANYLRFTFAASSLGAATVAACRVQLAGAGTLDFASAPVVVRAGGLSSFTVPANSILLSDPIPFPMDGSKDIVIAVALPPSPPSAVKRGSGTDGWSTGYKAGAEADTLVASGYTSAIFDFFVSKIEVGN